MSVSVNEIFKLDLESLPSIPLIELKNLPDISGHYFLYRDTELVYIGVAKNIKKRVKAHGRKIKEGANFYDGIKSSVYGNGIILRNDY
ncbi:MAG: hypothetical protein CLLPBCKN_006918 [Chroococcidiopsis cubana SAG 39.79]|uniref:GIY-YIG domain-containing protein n=1 Tax=Chroococcidiopsis cubana SAG 39.79 TaxID=388085 RepID=A0AB37U954_9CYAN|nr:hypothetical protein [Chroococcidiopsis cubana]MDZ4877483.1 hypothetical protein [Chroococcidiopsis cubana SAG 39.79]PSB60007.1 hypothetical protein C7B79_27360 [Chroococcidiopsis cubana CCALA 043]RUT01169.1 hypothetical protein DSM107010_65800 [Chroococcidiopsis cubana SAG 39.79]